MCDPIPGRESAQRPVHVPVLLGPVLDYLDLQPGLVVVDGTVGFTGGAGIADLWSGNAQDPDHWRDSHFKIEGPVVAQCQAAFMDNWLKMRSRVLQSREYFPEVASAGSHRDASSKSLLNPIISLT